MAAVIKIDNMDEISLVANDLEILKKHALAEPLRRSRYCLHTDDQQMVHEMIIAQCCDTYNPPHRHSGKPKSFHMIEGRMKVILFDDDGNVTRSFIMAPPGQGEVAIFRLNRPCYFTVVPLDEVVIVHETVQGPFDPVKKDNASWAPAQHDIEAGLAYLRSLV